MKTTVYSAFAILVCALFARVVLAQAQPTMTVQRDPGCGCCLNWVAHLEKAGFKVSITESPEMDAVKDRRGVPKSARSCHTGVVDGYVIEGHVPAADIKRLLKERPAVVGLAVPGMPAGSPGMEMSNGRTQPYSVLAFDKSGKTSVFAAHSQISSPVHHEGTRLTKATLRLRSGQAPAVSEVEPCASCSS